jgi:PAS domain S-box-containing protein
MATQCKPTYMNLNKEDGTPYPWEACPVFATLSTGTTYRCSNDVLWRKDGTSVPVEYVSTPIRERGEIVGAVIAFNDITERKQAEDALRVSEERYALAVQAGKVGVWDWNLTTGEIYVDPILKTLLGFRDHEIPNRIESWASHVHPVDRDVVMAAVQIHLDGLTPHYEIAHRMLQKDGGIRWFLARGHALRDAAGRAHRMVGTDTDITERQLVEEALHKAKEELARKVEERTIELQRLNEQLLADITVRQHAEEALGAEARFLRAQTDVAKVVLSSLHPEDFGPPLLETIRRTQEYDHGVLWRVAEDGETATMVAAVGDGTVSFVGMEQALHDSGSFAAHIMRSGQPAFRNHIADSPFSAHLIAHRLQAQALLGLPLLNRAGRVIGALIFTDTQNPERFTERDVTQGIVLASQVVQAFENSALFNQVNHLQEQYRIVTDALNDAVFMLDNQGRFAFGNAAGARLTGYQLEELLGRSLIDLVAPKDLPDLIERFQRAISGEALSPHVEVEMIRKDGRRVPVELSMANLMLDGRIAGRVGVARDITERRRADEQIKASLREKEVLLKEIHHRVKNNLQIISSLLNLQAKDIHDVQLAQMFNESQNRIKSMALIHEILYQTRDLARIDFAEYIKMLVAHLFHSYGAYSRGVRFEINVKDVVIDVDNAITCGLIVNEFVSNSLKYAFPHGKGGYIHLELSADEHRNLTFIAHDNGIGFPREIDFRKTDSLGLKLVIALTNQLAGTIELDTTEGTTFKMTFRDAEHKERKHEHGTGADHDC